MTEEADQYSFCIETDHLDQGQAPGPFAGLDVMLPWKSSS